MLGRAVGALRRFLPRARRFWYSSSSSSSSCRNSASSCPPSRPGSSRCPTSPPALSARSSPPASSPFHRPIRSRRASGLTRSQQMRHVVLPQAVRVVTPSLVGQFVLLIKDSLRCFCDRAAGPDAVRLDDRAERAQRPSGLRHRWHRLLRHLLSADLAVAPHGAARPSPHPVVPV